MVTVGVDACRYGWFTVYLDEKVWRVETFPDIFTLWDKHRANNLILIDIPIGLRESGTSERLCDEEARRLLGKRGSSVFPAPCRAAVYSESYGEASQINATNTGRKLPRQTWAIIPKIREVDTLLTTDISARSKIREIHPEICFWSLAGRPMEHPKKKEEGFKERLEVLSSVYPYTQELVDLAMRRYRRRYVARDDILDALAAAVTASMERRGLQTIPEAPEIDSKGLPMEMAYCSLNH